MCGTMLILGLSGGPNLADARDVHVPRTNYHDAACVLLRDGEVIAAIEEERLSRIKHTNFFPQNAIRFCLKQGGVSLGDIDAFAYCFDEHNLDTILSELKQSSVMFGTRAHRELSDSARNTARSLFSRAFAWDCAPDKMHFVRHHYAHATTAFTHAGFAQSLVLTMDGWGDAQSTCVFSQNGDSLQLLNECDSDFSLGVFYDQVNEALGLDSFEAYKVMGLAPYGDPQRFRMRFARCYSLDEDGGYSLDWNAIRSLATVSERRGRSDPLEQIHKDVAASLQDALEQIVCHHISHWQRVTGLNNLCIAGGVGLNCTNNGMLLQSGLFDDIFVHPAAHDAGNAFGAAMAVHLTHLTENRTSTTRLPHVYWGSPVGSDQFIAQALEAWKPFIHAERCDDVCDRGARLLAEDKVIGWVQGRSEFGPRALGNRSILADPRPAANKDIVNRMVKKREAFRPFAPAVLEESLHDYFETSATSLPFMIFVVQVKDDKQQLLGATTHVDGSARVQTVSRATNERFWTLIDKFRAITGVPVLLNTSFNNDAEPIVDSVEDAIVSFLTTGLHALIIGDYLVTRAEVSLDAYRALRIGLRVDVKITQRREFDRGRWSVVHEVRLASNHSYVTWISPVVFEILMEADGNQTIGELLAAKAQAVDQPGVLDQLLKLWSRRLVVLRP